MQFVEIWLRFDDAGIECQHLPVFFVHQAVGFCGAGEQFCVILDRHRQFSRTNRELMARFLPFWIGGNFSGEGTIDVHKIDRGQNHADDPPD